MLLARKATPSSWYAPVRAPAPIAAASVCRERRLPVNEVGAFSRRLDVRLAHPLGDVKVFAWVEPPLSVD